MTSSTALVFSMCQACSMLLLLFPLMNEETEASECSLALVQGYSRCSEEEAGAACLMLRAEGLCWP